MPETPNEREARQLRIQALVEADDRQEGERERLRKQQGRPEQSTGRKKRRRKWFHMDANMIDLKVIQFLTPREFQVYGVLCRFADEHGRVQMSQPMLGDILDVTDRTVRTALAGLERMELISKWQESMGTTGHIRLLRVRRIRRK